MNRLKRARRLLRPGMRLRQPWCAVVAVLQSLIGLVILHSLLQSWIWTFGPGVIVFGGLRV